MPADETLSKDIALFGNLLNEAVKRILWLYFKTPVAGTDEEIARERLFCYELYHQLRCVCDEKSFGYWLGGELDKLGHPIIRGDFKPDLVVHEPGFMSENLCVIEVKPILGGDAGYQNDVNKLLEFVTMNSYHAGIFLVFGDDEDGEKLIKHKVGQSISSLGVRKISVLWAKRAQSDLIKIL